MEGESGVSLSVIEELHSSDIQGYQREGVSGVTRSIIDELQSWDIPRRSNGRRKWCYSK